MSNIVLSASVRQNLLSLQSTADLLSQTQNRLATGNKVNTALDNPTNYFTAQSLNNRSSDISNLLDGVSNGVQVLQAANTGITSLQKLVDSAKSVAQQALQATVGYSTKSTVTSAAITGITADDLRGTGSPTDATATGAAETNNQSVIYSATTALGTAVSAVHQTAYTSTAYSLGSALHTGTASAVATSATALNTLTNGSTATLTGPAAGDSFSINGKTITFTASGAAATDASGNVTIGIDQTVGNLLTSIDGITGATGANASTINASGQIQINTGLLANLTVADGTGSPLAKIGLVAGSATRGGGVTSTPVITASTNLAGGAVPGGADGLSPSFTTSDFLIVNNKTITFNNTGSNSGSIGANNLSIGLANGNGTIGSILTAIGQATGGTATVDANGKINLTTSTTGDISLAGSSAGTLTKLGLSGVTSVTRTAAATPSITNATLLSGAASTTSDSLSTAFQVGDTINVNGQNLTFTAAGLATGNNQINVNDNVGTLLAKIDVLSGNSGGTASSVINGQVVLHTGTANDLSLSSSNTAALAALGFNAPVSQARGTGPSPLNGKTLAFNAVGNGTAVSVTFGDGTGGTVKSLNDLNNSLAADNLQASIDTTNHLVITTTNDAASSTIGAATGSSTASGFAFNNASGGAPVKDPAALLNRANLVDQYNNILDQIKTTAQDASYNGIDLINGDQLKLTFNETGSSTLKIQGVTFDYTGLGLSQLTKGTDFLDNSSANTTLSKLDTASSSLRTEASALGSNLSIVQVRQDFSKNLINVLQTGASNLTLADTNEEAANSQALSTRQSIAVSALALANQSQQSVLQLLR